MDDEQLSNRLQDPDMVRDRGLQEYEELLGIDITAMAEERGPFVWYDMCSGTFMAGCGLKDRFSLRGRPDICSRITAVGIDVETPSEEDYVASKGVVLRRANVVDYTLPGDVDLVTCLRGVTYIERFLGRGAEAVQNWYNAMPVGAVLAFEGNSGLPHDQIVSADKNPVMVDGIPLWAALAKALGGAVSAGYFRNFKEDAFSVKVTKQEDKELRLV